MNSTAASKMASRLNCDGGRGPSGGDPRSTSASTDHPLPATPIGLQLRRYPQTRTDDFADPDVRRTGRRPIHESACDKTARCNHRDAAWQTQARALRPVSVKPGERRTAERTRPGPTRTANVICQSCEQARCRHSGGGRRSRHERLRRRAPAVERIGNPRPKATPPHRTTTRWNRVPACRSTRSWRSTSTTCGTRTRHRRDHDGVLEVPMLFAVE